MAQEGRSILAFIFRNFVNSLRPRKFKGDYVGKDYYGNKYFEIPANPKIGKRKASRWFEPQTGEKDDYVHEVSPEWEAWLRGRRQDPPTEEELQRNLDLIKQKQENAKELEKMYPSKNKDFLEKEIKGMESFPQYDEYEIMPGKGKEGKQVMMGDCEELSVVTTKCAAASDFQVVVFNHKKQKTEKEGVVKKNTSFIKTDKKEMDMKRARYEVFKFGMSGLNPEKKEEANAALLVQLGAKPLRNKGYNYKEYKLMKQKQAEEEQKQKNLISIGKTKGKASFKRNKIPKRGKTKHRDGILDPYGKPGKVQEVSKTRKK